MKKILGIFALLVFVCLFTAVLSQSFIGSYNMQNITRWSALFGIISIGVAFVIITGGIDLSIGSVVGIVGCMLPWLMIEKGWPVAGALVFVMAMAMGFGLAHGLLITKLKLQPFVVTLCGLLIYRGMARWWTEDKTQGFGQTYNDGLRLLATGEPCSIATLIMIAGAVVIAVSLFRLVWQQRDAESTRLFWFVVFLGGMILAVVGSARFWYGYALVPGPVLVTFGDYAVAGVVTSVPQEGTELPQKLMYWIGLCVFVPTAIWFVVLGLISDLKKMLFPLAGLAVAGALFVLTTQYLAPVFETIEQSAVYRFGVIPAVSGSSLKWLVMAIVFFVVGFFMQSIGLLVSRVATVGGPPARSILPAVIGSGVLWLLGHTPLAATMVPMPMLIMIGLAVLASVFLGRTIYGRYLYALGRNEEAARYSGINTDRMVILAYVICSGMAGLGGILFALDINSVQPSGHGNFYELYAIAAAVLGGCSLRGGEGMILGVVIGAAVMRVLYNSINILGIPTQLEFAIIGFVILIAVIIDEVVKRMMAARRAAAQAKEMADTTADTSETVPA